MSTSSAIDPPVTFPLPAAPRNGSPQSGSSSRKRKREDDATSASSVSTKLTDKTSNTLKSLYRVCWLCSADTHLDHCHVIEQADRLFDAARAAGLLPFESLADAANGVRLCPTCHREYDDVASPGWIFFPSDLDFFVRFEEYDYVRRLENARRGDRESRRMVPSADEYCRHMASQGKVHDKDYGGLYERIVLRPGMFGARSIDPTGFGSASWHGGPLAPLLRTLMISGSPVCGFGIVPQHTRAQLRRLQDLYMRLDPVPEQVPAVIPRPLGVESMSLSMPTGPPVAPATSAAAASGAAALHTSAGPSGSANTAAKSSPMDMQQRQRTGHVSQSSHAVEHHDTDMQRTPSKKRRRRDTDTAADDEHARTAAASISSRSHSRPLPHPHAHTSKTRRLQKRKKTRMGSQSQKHDSHQGVGEGRSLRRLGSQGNGTQAEAAAAADERRGGRVWGWGPRSSSAEKAEWWPRMVGL